MGQQQARETGVFLDSLLSEEGIPADKVIWISSPFLRTLQTSNGAIDAFTKVDSDGVVILPDLSVSEYDSQNVGMHAQLPDLVERKMYFPRLDTNYTSMFVPETPGMCVYICVCVGVGVGVKHKCA